MRLRFFLFDENVMDFMECIRIDSDDAMISTKNEIDSSERQQIQLPLENDLPTDKSPSPESARYRRLRLSNAINSLSFEVDAWVLETSDIPSWFSFIAEYVATDDPSYQTTTSSDIYGMLVLLKLQPENRIFGVSFGYGYQLVRYERLESGFGRRVVLNTISLNNLRTLDVHNIDLVTRQKRIHVNKKGDTSDFRLDGEDLIVTGVIGLPLREYDLGRGQIEGTDSLLIALDENLKTIAHKCRQLFELYRSEHFSSKFPELTRLLPITGAQEQALFKSLFAALNARLIENISLMVPDLDYAYGATHYIVDDGISLIDLPEFELESFYDVIGSSTNYNWSSLRVGVCKEGQRKPSTWFYLLKGVIFLYEDGSEGFLYSFGYWYKITQDYRKRLAAKILEIPTFNGLPKMRASQSEGDYNARVANRLDYCLLDKKLIALDGRNRVEAADFVTSAWEFVCVKKTSHSGNEVHSSTLSHLFAQASVSAFLLANDRTYREKLANQIENRSGWTTPFNADSFTVSDITFVYAIATAGPTSLAERLPLFSRITLLNHTEEIRKLGYQVKLCRIDLANV